MKSGIVCPVCGFDDLPRQPEEYLICDCCGTEFELDDVDTSHEELRCRWLTSGANWFGTYYPAPEGWNPYTQLAEAGFDLMAVFSQLRIEFSGLVTSDDKSVMTQEYDGIEVVFSRMPNKSNNATTRKANRLDLISQRTPWFNYDASSPAGTYSESGNNPAKDVLATYSTLLIAIN